MRKTLEWPPDYNGQTLEKRYNGPAALDVSQVPTQGPAEVLTFLLCSLLCLVWLLCCLVSRWVQPMAGTGRTGLQRQAEGIFLATSACSVVHLRSSFCGDLSQSPSGVPALQVERLLTELVLTVGASSCLLCL